MADIEAVCRSAAVELTCYLPERDFDPISIRHDAKQGPIVIYGTGADGECRVLLNVEGTYWSQFSYQFGHEMCHILCNYRDGNKANLWFEESLCETASLFVLRQMAQTWKTKPPYANWKSYAEKLQEYAENRLKETEKLGDSTFAQWHQRNEPDLHKTGVNRAKNQAAARCYSHYWRKIQRTGVLSATSINGMQKENSALPSIYPIGTTEFQTTSSHS